MRGRTKSHCKSRSLLRPEDFVTIIWNLCSGYCYIFFLHENTHTHPSRHQKLHSAPYLASHSKSRSHVICTGSRYREGCRYNCSELMAVYPTFCAIVTQGQNHWNGQFCSKKGKIGRRWQYWGTHAHIYEQEIFLVFLIREEWHMIITNHSVSLFPRHRTSQSQAFCSFLTVLHFSASWPPKHQFGVHYKVSEKLWIHLRSLWKCPWALRRWLVQLKRSTIHCLKSFCIICFPTLLKYNWYIQLCVF